MTTMIDEITNSNESEGSQINDTLLKELLAHPETLTLNQILADTETSWQVHNCKIINKSNSKEGKLPFIYHYDTLPDDVKVAYPLNSELLKHFQTPMYPEEASKLLNLPDEMIKTPWQVKITGTLVMFSERLQIALRLKFTNTAKESDPVYTQNEEDALLASMKSWHFFGDVFVLNKGSRPLIMTLDEQWIHIPRSDDYQVLPPEYAITTLALLEEHKSAIPQLSESIKLRLA